MMTCDFRVVGGFGSLNLMVWFPGQASERGLWPADAAIMPSVRSANTNDPAQFLSKDTP